MWMLGDFESYYSMRVIVCVYERRRMCAPTPTEACACII